MFHTTNKPNDTLEGSGSIPVVPPQDLNTRLGVRENFTMYSRPTAFGPPSRADGAHGIVGSDSSVGENYPFTPPYYYGQAWADIKFVADRTAKYTIGEIIRASEVKYWRYVDPNSTDTGALVSSVAYATNKLINGDAMQLSASVNLLAQGEIQSVDLLDDSTSDKVNVAVDVSSNEKSRWIIQPYFETPMLNFNHLSASTSITLPTYGSQSVPRGMWHQYGRIEEDSTKGIFLQVDDIPNDWTNGWLRSDADVSGSLVDLCGFSTEASRLGQLKDSKTVFVLIGDGELQEGQNWEAIMFASAKNIDNLILCVDLNGKQIDGSTSEVLPIGNLKIKFEAFGWKVIEIENGNNLELIIEKLNEAKKETKKKLPICLLIKTEMGNGVDFMMNTHEWHGVAPNDEQLQIALSQNPETLGDY